MATRNAVPRADGEGSIGTTLKRWLSGFFKWLNVENYIQFVPNGAPSYQEGRLFYDSAEHTLSMYNENNEVTHNLGQEHLIRVYNDTGSEIANGKIVRIDAVDPDLAHPAVVLALADTDDNAHALGMTTSDIPDGEHGYVTQMGVVHDVDTSSFSSGDILFLSDTVAGALTIIKPSIVTLVGVILKADASTGSICISLEEYGAVGADMLKSIYDPDDDGVVDRASGICIFARKAFSGAIAKGKPVYLVGYNVGGWVEVEETDANDINKMPAIALTTESLTASITSKIAVFGRLEDLDTSSYSIGDNLYISETLGELINVKPQGNNYIQKIAQVIKSHASEGIIEIFGAGRINDVPNFLPYTEKIDSVDDDTILLEDSEDGYKKKKIKLANIIPNITVENPIATQYDIFSKYLVDETESTTTSEAYQQKLRMTVTVPEPGDYMLLWSCELYSSVANKPARVKIEQDDTTIINEVEYGLVMANAYSCQTGFGKVVMGSGSHTFDVDFSRQTGGGGYTVGIRRVRLYLKKTLA